MTIYQESLFGPKPGLVRHDHPDTSHAAALTVMPKTGTQRRRVLDFIGACGATGASDLEIQLGLRLNGNSERPRRVELVDAGLIEDSGVRREGHIVWTVNL